MNREAQRVSKLKNKRALRVRKWIRGTAKRPRMSVIKTNRHIAIQLIDDEKGHTLTSASTYDKKSGVQAKNKQAAGALGEAIASQAKSLGISEVVFDRGPFKYHGVLAEVAQAARAHGIQC